MTIYDVAKRAGVSIATVSRVINESDLVTEKTRKRVECVMNEIGYRPNIFARGLVTDTVKTVGVVSVDIRDSYYAEAVYNINCEMRRMDYGVIITNTDETIRDLKRELNFLLDRRVDGIILVGSVFSDVSFAEIVKEAASIVPLATINADIRGKNIYCTVCDDEKGTYNLMEKIHNIGKKRPIYICDVNTQSTIDKVAGYSRAVRELFDCEEKILHTSRSVYGGISVAEQIIDGGYDCAVFSNDMLAAGFAQRAAQLNIDIPGQIGIAGYDDLYFAKVSSPSLTTVNSRATDISCEACRTLITVIDGGRTKKLKKIEPKVVVRDSI